MRAPKVTVYVTCHNYARYLGQAIESVLRQSLSDWELLIIDDASTDDSIAVATAYAERQPERIRLLPQSSRRGIQALANEALRLARGDYIMRLDADDFLDENALLVLSHHLDTHPEVALVYPNYVYVDANGHYLGVEQRKRVGDSQLLDLPAHGACTMVRKRVLKALGGYDESHDRQDGHDLWLKISTRHPVANVPTPLFYYRQHEASITRDEERLLGTRARILRAHAERAAGNVQPLVAAVVPAKNTYAALPNVVLGELSGRPLIDHTLEAVSQVAGIRHVLVSTDDQAVVEHCAKRWPDVLPVLRPPGLSDQRASERELYEHALGELASRGIHPDALINLNVHTPLRRAEQIQAALDTLMLYNPDTVTSVYEDYDLHYVHAARGIEPLNPAMHRQIRIEREALFAGNGAIRAVWVESIPKLDQPGLRAGHVVMPRWDSFQIKSAQDAWLIERLLGARANASPLVPVRWKR